MSERLSAEGLERFAALADDAVTSGAAPGIVALVAAGDDVHAEVRGRMALDGPPMRRDSLFRITSNTKPITGAAVLSLVTEGLLELDGEVAPWLPELAEPRVLRRMDGPLDDTVAAARSITVRDLLTFTFGSGMTAEMFTAPEPWPIVAREAALELAALGPPSPPTQPDPDTWMARFGSLPLLAQPGERWLYNAGALVLGVLLSRVCAMPVAEALRARVLEPLGMRDTAFFAPDVTRMTTAYRAGDDGALVTADAPDGDWSSPPRFGDCAAGLVSTADDLLAFARMLLRGGAPVLSPGAVAAMCSPQVSREQLGSNRDTFLPNATWSFCQAVVTEGPLAGAAGWAGGYGTTCTILPEHDLAVVVLTQRLFSSPSDSRLHEALQRAALDAAR